MSLIRLLLIVPILFFAAPPAQAHFERAELEQMLAPIALYPDSVLSHVLIAATYPDQVAEAARWSQRHPDLQGEAAVDAVEKYDWDPSVKALVAFPEVLARMDEDPDWTDQLGEAFLDQEGEVMDAVQHLRTRAYEAGRLGSLENVRVVREREYIYIEPAVHGIIFVPYYDPWWVYGSWWWPHYPPYVWTTWYGRPVSYYGSSWYWGIGFHIRPAFYFTTFHWPARHVVVTHRHDRPLYSGRDAPRHQEVRHWRQEPSARRHADRKPGAERAERREPGAERREDRRPERGTERRSDRRDERDRRAEPKDERRNERKDERKDERGDRGREPAASLSPERRGETRAESRRERMERGRERRDAGRGQRPDSNGEQVRSSPERRDRSEPPGQVRREADAGPSRAVRQKPQAEQREEAGVRGQEARGRREEVQGRREEAQQGRPDEGAPRGRREEAQQQRDREEDRGPRGSGERAQGRQKDRDKGERGRSQREERSR